jgi:hypothetical protein
MRGDEVPPPPLKRLIELQAMTEEELLRELQTDKELQWWICRKMVESQVETELASLLALGLWRRNGEFKDGDPVYVLTELGKRVRQQGGFSGGDTEQ